MELQSFNKMLETARKNHYAIGAFNVVNLETLLAVVDAANSTESSVIIQVYHEDLESVGVDYFVAMARTAALSSKVPLCLSLDHGRNFSQAKKCIDAGFTGVMIDLSTEDLQLNIENTREVVEYAHQRGVSVEAELGKIYDAMAPIEVRNSAMTDPDIARYFVQETGVDALAVSIGTAHGVYSSKPQIDFSLLETLLEKVPVPLVVHGGSDTPDEDIARIVELGVSKINIGTDLMRSFNKGLLRILTRGEEVMTSREAIHEARRSVRQTIIGKIELLNRFRKY